MSFSADELQRLILRGENDTVEFKQRVTQPQKIARTLVSFANTAGGLILVGVKDNGLIVGIDPEEEKHTLQLAADFYCNPPIPLTYTELETDDGLVLVVRIAESTLKPHFAKLKDDDWRGYLRVNDTSVQTSKVMNKVLQAPATTFAPLPLNHHERKALEYLEEHPRLTLKQYMHLANLSERRAYRTLIKLVLHSYLRHHDKEKEVYYTLG